MSIVSGACQQLANFKGKQQRRRLLSAKGCVGGGGGRDLHSSTFRLNLSAYCVIGSALRGCSEVAEHVVGDIGQCSGCFLCQKPLRLS
jgi:hypothetical protein